MGVWSECGKVIADLAWGVTCVGCARPGQTLCGGCGSALASWPRPALPSPAPAGLPPVFAVAAYDGLARDVILAHKEQGRLALARPLGAALAHAVWGVLAASPTSVSQVALVPVPSRRGAVRARGHDPTLRMALAATRAARGDGADVRLDRRLRLRRAVADQAGLGAGARAANMGGAFVTRGAGAARRPVVLVDDVVTTGSTLAEAARALAAAEIEVVGAAVVAATARRG